jgi:hypothetical protein
VLCLGLFFGELIEDIIESIIFIVIATMFLNGLFLEPRAIILDFDWEFLDRTRHL